MRDIFKNLIVIVLILIFLLGFVFNSSCVLAETIYTPFSSNFYNNGSDYSKAVVDLDYDSYFSPYSTSTISLSINLTCGYTIRFASGYSISNWDSFLNSFVTYLNNGLNVRYYSNNYDYFNIVSHDLSITASGYNSSLGQVSIYLNGVVNCKLSCYNNLFNSTSTNYDYGTWGFYVDFAQLFDNYSFEYGSNITVSRVIMLGHSIEYNFVYPMYVTTSIIGFMCGANLAVENSDISPTSSISSNISFYDYTFDNTYISSNSIFGAFISNYKYDLNLNSFNFKLSKLSSITPNYVFNSANNELLSLVVIGSNIMLPSRGSQAIANAPSSDNALLEFYNSLSSTQSCEWYDLFCQLGNVVPWILHNNSIAQGIYNATLPLVEIVSIILDTITEFKGVGIVFMVFVLLIIFKILFAYLGAKSQSE